MIISKYIIFGKKNKMDNKSFKVGNVIDSPTTDILSLINKIHDYEPDIVRIIFYYVFVHCNQDKEGKYKYIRAISTPGTTSICDNSFYCSKNLEWVIIDNSVGTIGDSAFAYCSNMTEMSIPDSVKTIGDYAFYECSSLTHLTICNSVKTIGDYAFDGCSKLTTIYIPIHLETIVKDKKVFPENTKIMMY